MNILGIVADVIDAPAFRFILGVAILYLGYRGFRWGVGGLRRTLTVWRNEPIPIGEAESVDGTIEVEGTAEKLTKTISGNYSGKSCFAHSYKTKRKKKSKNSDGEWETDTTTVESGSNSVPFKLTDETGSIPIEPSDATIGMDTEYKRSSGNRRTGRGEKIKTEQRIDPGDELHVVGQKRPASEADTDLDEAPMFIGDGDEAPTFRITEGSELETVVRMFGRSVGAIGLGIVLIGFSLYLVGVAIEAQFAIGLIGSTTVKDRPQLLRGMDSTYFD